MFLFLVSGKKKKKRQLGVEIREDYQLVEGEANWMRSKDVSIELGER
jgi:hypothetical protein